VARTQEQTIPASRRDPKADRVEERRAPILDDVRGRGRVVERRAEACRGIAGTSRRVGRMPEPVRDPPIMTRRSRGREVALQVLYQVEQNAGVPLAEVRLFIQRRLLGDRKLCEFTEGLIAGVK
jgi:hypothetical protein